MTTPTIEKLIGDIWTFLEQYVPLMNTHGAEFISGGQWEKIVPMSIRQKLLCMSDDELCNLPLGNLEVVDGSSGDAQNHECLQNFLASAQQFQIENTGILSSLDHVLGNKDTPDGALGVISEAMCQKKIHEVGLMSEVVVALCAACDADLVIDIGSGKGYLSCELARKHHMPVLGLDSSETNTHSAVSRDLRLSQRWAGLTRRQQRQKEKKMNKNKSQDLRLPESEEIPNSEPVLRAMDGSIKMSTSGDNLKNNIPETKESLTGVSHSPGCDTVLNNDNDSENSMSTYAHGNNDSLPSSVLSSGTNVENHVDKNTDNIAEILDSNLRLNVDQSCDTKTASLSSAAQKSKTSPASLEGGLYVPVTMYVQPEMNVRNIIASTAPHLCRNRPTEKARLFIAGLHTCGSLAVTSLQLFLQDPGAVGLCSVGCCYQLMDEAGDTDVQGDGNSHFPLSTYAKSKNVHLGRNARNLACQAVHRIHASRQLQGGEFFWRALLDVLLCDLRLPVPEKIQGMRGLVKRCKTFYDYAASAFKKLGLPTEKLTPDDVEVLEQRYSEEKRRMTAFFQYKFVLAPVVETLILADRYLYLLEQDCVADAHLVRLFDPVTSPRCCALIARKKEIC